MQVHLSQQTLRHRRHPPQQPFIHLTPACAATTSSHVLQTRRKEKEQSLARVLHARAAIVAQRFLLHSSGNVSNVRLVVCRCSQVAGMPRMLHLMTWCPKRISKRTPSQCEPLRLQAEVSGPLEMSVQAQTVWQLPLMIKVAIGQMRATISLTVRCLQLLHLALLRSRHQRQEMLQPVASKATLSLLEELARCHADMDITRRLTLQLAATWGTSSTNSSARARHASCRPLKVLLGKRRAATSLRFPQHGSHQTQHVAGCVHRVLHHHIPC
mmetsp:Transcript_3639/g.9204  ORF Transcript_3639/g.9204 Transcript_3639/m.9204 type:complete len:270 (+) Transcript_3639:635-1444(+)